MTEKSTKRKGPIIMDSEFLGPGAAAPADVDRSRRLDRKRGPGEQVYVSDYIKKAMTDYARKTGRHAKWCYDTACATYLRAEGVEIALQPEDEK